MLGSGHIPYLEKGDHMKRLLLTIVLMNVITYANEATENPDAWRTKAFTYIYKTNHWKDSESFSGPGSTMQSTKILRTLFPAIISALEIHILFDAGCGDFNWMKSLNLNLDLYIGADIVEELIDKNQVSYGNNTRCFLRLDITKDYLPQVDAIFCRDCLAHLSYADIMNALRNFKKSGITYLIASSFPKTVENKSDIRTGDYRPVNLQAAPFNFPEPIMSFEELSAEPAMKRQGKRLCVWRIDDLHIQ